jgi:hypothetical protein
MGKLVALAKEYSVKESYDRYQDLFLPQLRQLFCNVLK